MSQTLLGGRVKARQPDQGFRGGHDAVFLAAAVPGGGASVLELGAGAGSASLCLAARRPDLSRTYWAQYLARDRGPFADVLRRGIDEGLLRPDLDLELVVDLITGAVFKRALWQLDTPDADLAAIVDTVLAGLVAPGSAP